MPNEWFIPTRNHRGKLKNVPEKESTTEEEITMVDANNTENECSKIPILSVLSTSTTTKILRIQLNPNAQKSKKEGDHPVITPVNNVLANLKQLIPSLTLLNYNDEMLYPGNFPIPNPHEFNVVAHVLTKTKPSNPYTIFIKCRYDDDTNMTQVVFEEGMNKTLIDNGIYLHEHRLPIERVSAIGSIYLIHPYFVNLEEFSKEYNSILHHTLIANQDSHEMICDINKDLVELSVRTKNKTELIRDGKNERIEYPIIEVKCPSSINRSIVKLIVTAKLDRTKFGQFALFSARKDNKFKDLIMHHYNAVNERSILTIHDIPPSIMSEDFEFYQDDMPTKEHSLFMQLSTAVTDTGQPLIDKVISVEILNNKWRMFVKHENVDAAKQIFEEAIDVVRQSMIYKSAFPGQRINHLSIPPKQRNDEEDRIIGSYTFEGIPEYANTSIIRPGTTYRDVTTTSVASPSSRSSNTSQISMLQEQHDQLIETLNALQNTMQKNQEAHTAEMQQLRTDHGNEVAQLQQQMHQREQTYNEHLQMITEENRKMVESNKHLVEAMHQERRSRDKEMRELIQQIASSGALKTEKRSRDNITSTPSQAQLTSPVLPPPSKYATFDPEQYPPPMQMHPMQHSPMIYPGETNLYDPSQIPHNTYYQNQHPPPTMYPYPNQYQPYPSPIPNVAPQHVVPQHVAPQHVAPQQVAPQHFVPQHVAPQHYAVPQTDYQQSTDRPQSSLTAALEKEAASEQNKFDIKEFDSVSLGETPIRDQYNKPAREPPTPIDILLDTSHVSVPLENTISEIDEEDDEGTNCPAGPPDLAGQRL